MTTTQKRLIIGLTGPIGSGVSTIAQLLETKGFHRIKLSEAIKDEFLKKQEKPPETSITSIPGWREQLQDLGDVRRKSDLAYWLKQEKAKIPDSGLIVIDAIRNLGEIDYLRELYPRFFLVATVASKETRWNRVKSDYRNDLGQFEKVDKRDSEDRDDIPYGQQVGLCVNEADYVFLNDRNDLGSKENREKQLLDELWPDVELMLGEKSRNPFEYEVFMTEAYTLSHRSRCLKRYVGAVIIDKDGQHLSAGYNENPAGMKPCIFEFQTCYKDTIMEKELEERPFVFCPVCGEKNVKLSKPWQCNNCKEDLKKQLYPSRNMEKCTALHAEERAIKSLSGRSAEGGTMYVTTFPCLQCARYIVDCRISKVVYVEAYPVTESIHYLTLNRVEIEPFRGFKARAFNLVFKPVR